MDPLDVTKRLAAIEYRSVGSDAERRGARLLAAELRGLGRRGVRTQTFWVRPAWPAVHALLATVGVAGSVASVKDARLGLGLAIGALLLLLLDLSGRFQPLRLLTMQRATQNVVSLDKRTEPAVRLVITTATDVPRGVTSGRGALAGAATRLRARLGGHLPSVHGAVVLALVAIVACCSVRTGGTDARWLGAVQLAPTVVLLLAIGLFVDSLTAPYSREGAVGAGAAAVALALVAELDARPPKSLAVDVVFAGAGEAHAAGMRRWVAEQRKAGLDAEEVCVLDIAACGAGAPVWWRRDGLVIPLAYHPRLIANCEQVARDETHLGARAHESRSTSGARAARAAGWPAIAIGSLPRSGALPQGDADNVESVDPASLRNVLELAIGMVARLDSELQSRAEAGA